MATYPQEKSPVPPPVTNTAAELGATHSPSAPPLGEPLQPPTKLKWNQRLKKNLDSHKDKGHLSLGFLLLLAWILPPAAVLAQRGANLDVLLNIILWLIGWLPGVAHACYIVLADRKK